MSNGTWVYNWIKKRCQWVVDGKAYDSPAQVPTPQTKRPYVDPGKKVINKTP